MSLWQRLKVALGAKAEPEHLRRGKLGERAAKRHLQKLGLKFLVANFRSERGEIDLVIVGSDRTLAKTGEVTNKIGTYTKAVLAKRHNIPFYIAIPYSTLDWNLSSGFDIPIEERSDSEVLGAWGTNPAGKFEYVRVANPGSTARNPGFDVTPPELITGIITPAGIFKPRDLWRNRTKLGYKN